MTDSLAGTPLHDWHAAHGGRMVDFAGWSMPVQYASIAAEHAAVRTAAGLFDVSHMGRLLFNGTAEDGSDTTAFLDGLLTRRVSDMKTGQVRYSLVTNDAGGILDDVLVYRLQSAEKKIHHLLVVNASNREKIISWIKPRLAGNDRVLMTDATHDWAMIAVQGPKALKLVQPLVVLDRLAPPLSSMRYYQCVEARIDYGIGKGQGSVQAIVSRTGYTGEDGWELIFEAKAAAAIWSRLLADGAADGVTACGLGARDTLRLEAGMPLYGHELTESINPFAAGVNFAVNLEHRSFPGHDALVPLAGDPKLPRRVGLSFEGKRVPRENYQVLSGSEIVGRVTSGTFSPTFNQPIAMAYVDAQHAEVGMQLAVDVRGKAEPCKVVPLPFYRRGH
jgi:aminomethyltransferase